MCSLQHSWTVPHMHHTHSCATLSIPHFHLLSHSTLFPSQRTWSSILSCRTEGSSLFPSLLNLIQLFDVNIQGTVCSLMLPNLTSRVHLWLLFLQLSHRFLLKEGTTKIFGLPQPQRTQGHHWTCRISQRWVWSSFSSLHCNTWLLSWGKDWNIWSQLPLSSCNQYFPFQIQSIYPAWQLSWLPLFSWGTQPHADAIYTLGKLFLQPFFPNKPSLVSHPKGESRDLWLWKMPWHFLISKSRVLARCQLWQLHAVDL